MNLGRGDQCEGRDEAAAAASFCIADLRRGTKTDNPEVHRVRVPAACGKTLQRHHQGARERE